VGAQAPPTAIVACARDARRRPRVPPMHYVDKSKPITPEGLLLEAKLGSRLEACGQYLALLERMAADFEVACLPKHARLGRSARPRTFDPCSRAGNHIQRYRSGYQQNARTPFVASSIEFRLPRLTRPSWLQTHLRRRAVVRFGSSPLANSSAAIAAMIRWPSAPHARQGVGATPTARRHAVVRQYSVCL
jgi:hypothetical protein